MDLVPVTRSGLGVEISGQVVAISGQAVSLASGTIVVGQSGLNVVVQSGLGVVGSFTVSGQPVGISGETVFLASGTLVYFISGETSQMSSGLALYVQLSGVTNLLSGLQVMISGAGVLISGQGVTLQSGQTVLVQAASGESLRVSGLYVVMSGQGVLISGQTVVVASGLHVGISGQPVVAFISGEVTYFAPSSLLAGYSQITGDSGGIILASGVVVSVEIRNLPGNDNMWVGPPGVNSGAGWLLQGGEIKDIDIGSLGAVYLVAATSGQYVSYLGLVV
jgi:hypothetical protein